MSGPGRTSISYDVSKAAVAHLTRGLALDLAPQHIIVNNLAPGVFPSRMTQYSISTADETLRQETLFGRLGNEPDMAGIILWLCSRASSHIVGQSIFVDGGSVVFRSNIIGTLTNRVPLIIFQVAGTSTLAV